MQSTWSCPACRTFGPALYGTNATRCEPGTRPILCSVVLFSPREPFHMWEYLRNIVRSFAHEHNAMFERFNSFTSTHFAFFENSTSATSDIFACEFRLRRHSTSQKTSANDLFVGRIAMGCGSKVLMTWFFSSERGVRPKFATRNRKGLSGWTCMTPFVALIDTR